MTLTAKTQTKEERDYLFGSAPVGKALATMTVPTIVSQLINLIYNIADTFFVGRTGNPYMIAAVSVTFTLFMLNIPMSGMFGVGGGSYIARLLGIKDYERIKHISAFSFYGALALSVLYSLVITAFMTPILSLLGASSETMSFAKQYVWVVVVIGNIPTVMSATLAHILRNVGYSKQASYGLSGGGILNIILDPLFMFVILPDGYQVLGAAIATTISNTASFIYFLVILKKTQSETGLSMRLADAKVERADAGKIFYVGIPQAVTTVLVDFSNMFLNAAMAGHGDLQLAALGIVTKVERLSNSTCLAIAMGMLPLVAYNYSTKNYPRMRSIIRAARITGLCIGAVSIALYEIFAGGLISLFISSKEDVAAVAATVAFGVVFLRIRCLSAPFSMLNFISTYSFQAMGDGRMALIQAIIRQLVCYLPLLYLLDILFGQNGLAAAYPASELVSGIVATILLAVRLKKARLQFSEPKE